MRKISFSLVSFLLIFILVGCSNKISENYTSDDFILITDIDIVSTRAVTDGNIIQLNLTISGNEADLEKLLVWNASIGWVNVSTDDDNIWLTGSSVNAISGVEQGTIQLEYTLTLSGSINEESDIYINLIDYSDLDEIILNTFNVERIDYHRIFVNETFEREDFIITINSVTISELAVFIRYVVIGPYPPFRDFTPGEEGYTSRVNFSILNCDDLWDSFASGSANLEPQRNRTEGYIYFSPLTCDINQLKIKPQAVIGFGGSANPYDIRNDVYYLAVIVINLLKYE